MAEICLSRIESSAFKISSYAGPSVQYYWLPYVLLKVWPIECTYTVGMR